MQKEKTADEMYFLMQAEMGLTKHVGGKRATKELIELCKIDESKRVLDVGCGAGKTACFIAKEVGCNVVAVDLYKEMIEKARDRAKRKGVLDKIEFKAADALNLPFKDNSFDAVFCESVAAFFKDKQKGLNEFRRVVKPEGFVGINEMTWIGSPPKKIIDSMKKIMGAEFENHEGWKKLLEQTGLKEINARVYKLNALQQFLDEISWMELKDFFGPWHKVIMLFIKDPEYRKYLKTITKTPWDTGKFMGHGIYTGKK
ncbi:MAG: class I SAM-dependent methyltransferase [archaeon]